MSATTPQEWYSNVDCALGSLDTTAQSAGTVPTLANALGRICSGNVFSLSTTNTCTGSGSTSQGKVSMSISQQLSTGSSSPGSGTVLKLDLACAALATELD